MPSIALTCPICHFSKQMEVSAVPRPGTQVTCPACKSVFPLQGEAVSGSGSGDAPPREPEGAAVAPADQAPRTLTFDFTGNAQEYFGIWIVNTLLRIVTLGM